MSAVLLTNIYKWIPSIYERGKTNMPSCYIVNNRPFYNRDSEDSKDC